MSVTRGEVDRWEVVRDVRPPLQIEESIHVLAALHEHPEWNAALDRRGIVDRSLVQIDPWPAGTFGLAHEEGRRITRCLAYLRESPDDNGYAATARGPARLRRHGPRRGARGRRPRASCRSRPSRAATTPRTTGRCAPTSSRSRSPSPRARASTVDGNLVRWQKWSLRVGMDPLEGLVLYTVGYEDGGRVRPILYRASVSEMVVPYGAPGPDARVEERVRRGRVGPRPHGQLAHARLRLPRRDPLLRRRLRRREGQAAHAGQRHLPARGGLRHPLEARRHGLGPHRGAPLAAPRRELHRHRRQLRVRLLLVLLPRRHHPARGEADRDHVDHGGGRRRRRRPRQDGGARAWRRRTTSICSTSASTSRSTAPTTRSTRSTPPAPAAPGTPENPWGNVFGTTATLLETELAARRDVDPSRSRTWRIANRSARNGVGEPTAYKLLPASTPDAAGPPGLERGAPRRVRHATTCGSRRSTPRSGGPPATTRTSTAAAPACPSGRRGTDRSSTPTSCCGTRSASPTSRGPRTGRSCRSSTPASPWSRSASSTATQRSTCRPRPTTATMTDHATRHAALAPGVPPAGRGVPRDDAGPGRGGRAGDPGAHRGAPGPLGARRSPRCSTG